MKIYSWNMLFRNPDMDRAFQFIANADFDVFCLQEVPEDFYERLKTLPFYLSAAPEVERIFNGARSSQYLVTLSRFSLNNEGRIPLPYREIMLPLRARIFVGIMTRLKLWALGVGNRHSLYTDLETPEGTRRVFNLHLPLATPAWRSEEFEKAMLERDPSIPTIVCGDFNILERLHITPISWALGGTLGDFFFYRRERVRIEERFFEHQLTNPLRGKITHRISRSQLDHILVSQSIEILNAEVIADNYGSDHQPIFAEVA